MTLWTCSVRPRLATRQALTLQSQNHIGRRKQPHPSALFTPYPKRNLWLCIILLTRTLLQGSFVPLGLHVEPQSSSLRKKDGLLWLCPRFSRPQPNFQERSLSAPTHLRPPQCTENGMGLHQNRPSACVPLSAHYSWRRMEDSLPDPLQLL